MLLLLTRGCAAVDATGRLRSGWSRPVSTPDVARDPEGSARPANRQRSGPPAREEVRGGRAVVLRAARPAVGTTGIRIEEELRAQDAIAQHRLSAVISLAIATACSAAATPAPGPRPPTSAADMGGVDAICAAGKTEGTVNLIATPDDWANYGQMITDFSAKYGIKVQSDQPDADSQTEIDTAKQLAGTGRQPDIFDLGDRRRPGEHRHVRPVQGRRRGPTSRMPTRKPTGPLGQQLHRLRDDRLRRVARHHHARSPTSPTRSTRARSPSTAIRSRPSAGFNGVVLAALANGGSADNIQPGVDFFKSPHRQRQPAPGRPGSGHDRRRHDPDRHRLDVQPGRARRHPEAEGHRLEDRRPERRAAGRGVLQLGDQQGRRASGGCPLLDRVRLLRRRPEHVAQGLRRCRSASRPCRRPTPSTRRRSPRSTRRPTAPVQLTPAQTDTAKAYLTDELDVHHHQVAFHRDRRRR